jgi:predicted phosphodiesterase
MIYVTGDTHGDYKRFTPKKFPAQKKMSKQDYVIVCGDFGFWDDTAAQRKKLDRLEARPFTTLFITGNHENYDLLKEYEVTEFCGGQAQFIRPTIIHLMRGQVFIIENKRFFTMGGASCHDIEDGILRLDDPNFLQKKNALDAKCGRYRVEHLSWWKEELPNADEYKTAWKNLENHGNKVDYILSHCPPESIRLLLELLGVRGYPSDSLTEFLEERVSHPSWNLRKV